MSNFIRLGDLTSHGGTVISASQTMSYDGIPVARMGDPITCPMHPQVQPNVIIAGDASTIDEGIPVARAGHKGTCGCELISSIA
ncbi:PAAR domain-containing protein [Burkholderia ubonensis]|uniref:PAAR domain-containing protein n=1 Tax=Burkholderia ubonensis TaxID=101571 RepID=UPI0007563763|nr:PAAR domain-containing protein [Burkholderia ubonensis]KWB82943.1 hypothetical protein WL42_07305 [Burkholderia ubonensis]